MLALCEMAGVDWPIVHVVIDPVQNPDCADVRDRFFAMYPSTKNRYDEVVVRCVVKSSTGRFDTNGAYRQGFKECARRYGRSRISGIRAEESATRKMSIKRHGVVTVHGSIRPIAKWTSDDVFGFISANNLPLAAAYPCSLEGMLDRGRVRLNNLWGLIGEGHGRREWEWKYYRNEIVEIERFYRRLSSGVVA